MTIIAFKTIHSNITHAQRIENHAELYFIFFSKSVIQITVGQYRLITNMFMPLIKFRLVLSSRGQWL